MITPIIHKEKDSFEWIDISAPTKEDFATIALKYNLSEASIKDCIEPAHLPKIEAFESYTFIILRAFSEKYKKNSDTIVEITERLSIFYGANFIITIHKKPIEFLENLKREVQADLRYKGPRHIAYALALLTVSSYENIANFLAERLDKFEEVVFLTKNRKPILQNVYYIKRQVDVIKKILALYRPMVSHFDTELFKNLYTRDIEDIYLRCCLLYDNLSENTAQLLTIYFNISSNHTNEIMRTLTVFSVFFMPLTFIAGIYGMNFANMPELAWYYGYPLCIAIMTVLSLAIYFWFKRKGWL
ncbi:magnesium transporter CorA [Sphingobacteriaceae bacterium WQ 2009]|uniref:Magnesium transporter CorA n=1 Tax=Rhinopithecimicrobium faecis TaxID=2820698 RepID=A0A8T4HAT6_9SPHI|nr:magnesium transporter CorA [Sphingobacteriaceae bacterium WQ 2009]